MRGSWPQDNFICYRRNVVKGLTKEFSLRTKLSPYSAWSYQRGKW